MATVTAGNSVSVAVSGDQTVSITVTHNNSGKVVFTPTASIQGVGGTGHQFGPLPTSATYGPWGVAGTLVISCDIGTVTYTVADSYFPNQVGIQRTPSYPLDVAGFARFSSGVIGSGGLTLYGDSSSTVAATLSTAGNLGVGVTPSAWSAGVGFQFGTYGAAYSRNAGVIGVGANQYFNGTSYTYVTTNRALDYRQDISSGAHSWYTAVSGTAGNAITFAQTMTLDANGNIYGTAGTTTMTNGFFYIPSAAGAPTGAPTAVTGTVPMYYDTTSNKFYVYNGAWKGVVLA